MLSGPDRELVERDPQLPGLGTLLDPEAFAALAAGLYPDAQVHEAVATYLRYKPSTSCLVGYRLALAKGDALAYARASRLDAPHKIHKAARREPVASALGPGVRVAADLGITVYPFPNDHELRTLAALAGDDSRRELLAALLPRRPELWSGAIEPLRYKPERRFVASLRDGSAASSGGGPAAVLKFVRTSDVEVASAAVERLRSARPLRLPRLLGCLPQQGVFALEWIEGEPLRDLLHAAVLPLEAFRTAGMALAHLHDQEAKSDRVLDGHSVAGTLQATAADVRTLAPALAPRAEDLLARLQTLLAQLPRGARAASLHGDFSLDQVLARDGEAAIVDLDDSAHGDPAIDVAWLEASMLAAVVMDGIGRERARTAFEAFADGYRRHRALAPPRHLAALTAAGLLRRAVEPFRLRVPAWPRIIEALVAEAEEIVGRTRTAGAAEAVP